MRTEKVIVLPYQESWARDFEQIAAEINAVLADYSIRIEHVGSTSIPGCSAKPIIDIDLVVKKAELARVIELLATIGYHHEGDLGIKGREAFTYEGKSHLQAHHLYVCPEDSEELKRHLRFRDYLRSHPAEKLRYSRVKEAAAQAHPNEIEAYMAQKSPVIEEIYRRMWQDME